MNEQYISSIYTDEIDESYEEKLEELLTKTELNIEEISELDETSKKIYQNYGSAEEASQMSSLENPELEKGYKKKSLSFLEKYSDTKEHVGASLEKIKPESYSHYLELKSTIASNYIMSLQSKFEALQRAKAQSNISELGKIVRTEEELETEIETDIKITVIDETDSPYYKVKHLLKKVEAIYDELALYYLSKNYTYQAHNYYYLLGEILVKEIYYSNIIGDDFLYCEEDKALLYRNAGEAFLRAYKIINDKHIVVYYAAPTLGALHSNISDLFGTGNVMQAPEKLSIFCFEIAKELFRTIGNKKYYLEARSKLYELKAETNDFESNISRLFVEISKNFVKNKAPFLKMLDNPDNIKEEYVRDYFMSHINLMIEEISVAENLKARGRCDLTIFGKDNSGKVLEAISEFKIWGRNGSKVDHSYKNVLNQLRIYMSDFEEFGIVVMINPNKSSIKDKYIQQIIKMDKYFIDNSIDEPYSEGSFINLKSEHFAETDENKKIRIYHFILNIQGLFFEK